MELEHTITKEQYDGMPVETYAGIDYPVHRFANFIPIADDKDQHALRESIKDIGLLDAIVLYEGSILDGRHRYMACQKTGKKPHFVQFEGDEESALKFVMGKNIARRMLTVSQKLALIKKLKPEIDRIREAAAASKAASQFGGESPGILTEKTDTLTETGKLVNLSRATVARADAVERAAAEFPESKFLQEMAAKMLNGEVGVKTAYVDVSAELDKLANKEAKLVDPAKQLAKLKAEVKKAHEALIHWDTKIIKPDYELAVLLDDLSGWAEEAHYAAKPA